MKRTRDALAHTEGWFPGYSLRSAVERLRPTGIIGTVKRGRGSEVPSARYLAALVLSRLATPHLIDVGPMTKALAEARCCKPVIRPGEDPDSRLPNIPDEWIHTAALPAGHTVLDLMEAFIADAVAGHLEVGFGYLHHCRLSWHWPLGIADLGPSVAAETMILSGNADLAWHVPTARYGKPLVLSGSALQAFDRELNAEGSDWNSPIDSVRSLPLLTVALFAESLHDD